MPQGIFDSHLTKSFCSVPWWSRTVVPETEAECPHVLLYTLRIRFDKVLGPFRELGSYFKSHYVCHFTCYSALTPQAVLMFFLRPLKSAPFPLDITFRQYSRHRGTQEYFHPQGSNAVSAAGGGDRQRLSRTLRHQHFDHQRVQLPACRPLSHRRGGSPRAVYGGQPADIVRDSGLLGHTHR